MKVAKFGGSSLSSASQIKKVANIIKNDPDIRAVVVSAPGKREESDTKVTDLLIALFTNHLAGLDVQPALESINRSNRAFRPNFAWLFGDDQR